MLLKTNKETILYLIIVLLITELIMLTFFPGIINAVKDSGKTDENLCVPDPGYTEEAWREHMSHHPEMYKECLK